MDDEFIIDVYRLVNPYMNEIEHLERIRLNSAKHMEYHLRYVEDKYHTQKENNDFLITVARGEASANELFNAALNRIARMPEKHEIN